MNRGTQITVTHPSHDRLVQLKLQGALHLAKVLETHPSDAMRFKAALALARLAIPPAPPCHRLPADGGASQPAPQPATTLAPTKQPEPNSPSLREGAGGRVRDAHDKPETVTVAPSSEQVQMSVGPSAAPRTAPAAKPNPEQSVPSRPPPTSPGQPAVPTILSRATAALGVLTRAGASP